VNTFDNHTNISFPLQLPINMQPCVCEGSTVFSESTDELQAASVSDFLGALFALLNDNAIQYCVLKRGGRLSGVGADTLELAVHPEHRKELPKLFNNLPKDRYQPVQCIGVDVGVEHFQFALHGSRPQFLRVEVLYVRRNVLLSAVQNDIFLRRQRQGNCWMAAPADEFSYLLAKTRQTGALTNPDEERLKLLVERLGRAGAETVAGQVFGLAVRTEVVTACSTGALGTILHKLRHPVWHNNPVPRNVYSLFAVIRKGWQSLHNWFHPNGLLIAILGPDGAGKTTISTKIFDVLGPGFGPRKLLMWRPAVLPRLSQDVSINLPHSKPPHGRLESLARILATFLDYWVGHFILVKPLLSRSALILYDRDIHDILVDSRRYRYGGPRWVLPFLTNALPQTESIFLILDAAPEVILERKQEVSREELCRQLEAYRRLAAKLPNSYLIRTDGDLEATTSAVTQSVVDHLGRRYERRYVPKQDGDTLRTGTKRLQSWATTVSMAVADLYSQRRSWLQKGLLAVLDQGLISGSNFLLAILLARWLSAEQYGAYALSFAIFVLFSFIQQGLFLEPMSVFGPSIYRNSQREYLGTLIWLQGALAAVALVLAVFAVATFLHNDTGLFPMALLGMAFSAPCVLLYWFSRRAFYLQLRPGRAVGGALLYWVLLSIGVGLLVRTRLLSPFTAFLSMGVAALFTSVHQLRQLRPILSKRKKTFDWWSISKRHWNYGRWATLGSLFIWIPWSVYYPVVAHFSGLAEVASLRALLNLALPVTQTLSAFTLLFLPHASHISEQESWDGARGLALRITAFFALGAVMYWLPVCLFRVPLLQFLYAGHYSQIARLVPWIGLSSVLSGMALGPTIAFRAMRSPATVTFFYFVSSAVTLVLGIPATRVFGIPGAVTCILLSNIVAVVLGWTMLTRQWRGRIGSRLVEEEAVP
jgi:O-antigen/teichoic acid export membrane protein/thymidylate kinase